MLNLKTPFFFADVNDHCVHSDGHMSGYFIDKEAKSIPNNKEKKYPEQEVQVLLQLLTVPKTKSDFKLM
jgi:hypothetical protein